MCSRPGGFQVESPRICVLQLSDDDHIAGRPDLGSVAACDGRLHEIKVKWDERACACVVVASGGYPGKYQSGFAIGGLDEIKDEDTIVFHAGTKNDGGTLVTNGGRVLGVASLGRSLEAAATKAYNAVSKIEFDHMFFRRDIGGKGLIKPAYGRH